MKFWVFDKIVWHFVGFQIFFRPKTFFSWTIITSEIKWKNTNNVILIAIILMTLQSYITIQYWYYNTNDIKNNDCNHDEINHNSVARQYIKVWWNGGIDVASACLNWLTLASYSLKSNSTGGGGGEGGDANLVEPNCAGKLDNRLWLLTLAGRWRN